MNFQLTAITRACINGTNGKTNCAACGGEFGTSYASCGAVSNVIPVDTVIPGCPPTPETLVKGLLGLMEK
jgi:NADH:ubiquinone oxidoreductase subunit B-like Fe-S oxidoreductase